MAQITILNPSNEPQGPFNREEVARRLVAREFTLDSLAHAEGFAQWTPLREVLAKVDAVVPPPPPVAPSAQAPAYSYAATMEPPSHLVYAGFWLRLVAYVIDGFILFVAFVIINVPLISILVAVFQPKNPGALGGALADVEMLFIGLPACWLYFALQESGSTQATFGKRFLGLRVTDMAGQRIGFGRASGRFFGKIVSSMTIYIGFIMAGFTERKQALHDMMAGTLVVRS